MRDPLLTRHFLQRFLDNDVISPQADRHVVLSVTLATLITSSLFITAFLALKYLFQPLQSPGRTAITALDDRMFYIALSMVVMGLVAVAAWDGLSLDARDAAILGPLPVSTRRIVRAKAIAVVLFAGGFALALNGIPSVLHPLLMTAKLPIGARDLSTLVAVHAAVTVAAGTFAFASVLAARELLRAIIGVRLFGRCSTVVQACLVVVFATSLLLLPSMSTGVARRWLSSSAPVAAASPPLWFVGLFETLAGEALDRMPRRELPARIDEWENESTAAYRSQRARFRRLGTMATSALLAMLGIGAVAYAWNVRGAFTAVPARKGRRRAPAAALARATQRLFGWRPVRQAGFVFTLQCLARSPHHRLSMMAALAVGLAASAVTLYGIDFRNATRANEMPTKVLAVQTLLLVSVLAGFRHAIRLPADLRASWLFQFAWPPDEASYMAGVKCAALLGTALPVVLGLLPLHLVILEPNAALAHAVFGVLVALVLLDVMLFGYDKLPFAARYAPSGNLKSWGPVCLLTAIAGIYGFAHLERLALLEPRGTILLLAAMLAVSTGLTVLGRLWPRQPAECRLDDSSAEESLQLNLSG